MNLMWLFQVVWKSWLKFVYRLNIFIFHPSNNQITNPLEKHHFSFCIINLMFVVSILFLRRLEQDTNFSTFVRLFCTNQLDNIIPILNRVNIFNLFSGMHCRYNSSYWIKQLLSLLSCCVLLAWLIIRNLILKNEYIVEVCVQCDKVEIPPVCNRSRNFFRMPI